MNFWWGRRSKGGHRGNLWNVNIFFFLATFWTALLITFARIKLSEFFFSSLAPISPAKQEIRNESLLLHDFSTTLIFQLLSSSTNTDDQYTRYFPWIWAKRASFVLLCFGGPWGWHSWDWECLTVFQGSGGNVYECTLLIVVIFLLPVTHTNKCTPPPSVCRWSFHQCDFNHSFHHRRCFCGLFLCVFWCVLWFLFLPFFF